MRTLLATAFLSVGFLAACSAPQNPDQIRERTANATAAAKADTKAVAQGIKEGLSKNSSVDLNSASKDDLMKLPGITDARAERIMAARPYSDPDELVTKKVLTKGEYNNIASRVRVKK
jgi:DNA uptake protein ComE-like DNA-binding protein